MENMVKLSPGELEGTIWDEGGKTKVVQIQISHDTSGIKSIKFVYVVDGKLIGSKTHGQPNGLKFHIVTFNHPVESLVSLSGEYEYGKLIWITFGTNTRKYGPFGRSPRFGSIFEYSFTKSSFGGFHGSLNDYGNVSGIGIYIRPLESLAELSTSIGSDKK